MAKITVDGVEYETETLNDNGKAQLASMQFIEAHMIRLRNEIAVFETAKRAYTMALKNEMDKAAAPTDAGA